MTRSTQRGLSRREAFTKLVRQKAHSEGIMFATALSRTLDTVNGKLALKANPNISEPICTRRNPGRSDGVNYNGSYFICPPKIDDGDASIYDEDVYDFNVDFADSPSRRQTDMTVSLLDIARPAKQKGAAKEFEIVNKVRDVIVLEDEAGVWEDDWEEIYDVEHRFFDQKSYSSVLRGNER